MGTKHDVMFESATRTKIRFQSPKGPLTLEQLWDVPLESKDNFDLNAVAKLVNRELKTLTEENFVETAKNPAQDRLELALDLVKYVIVVKLDEAEAAKTRAENKKEEEQLLEILAEKEKGELSELSIAQLKKRIAALKK